MYLVKTWMKQKCHFLGILKCMDIIVSTTFPIMTLSSTKEERGETLITQSSIQVCVIIFVI